MTQLEESLKSIFTDRRCSPGICGFQVMNWLWMLPAVGKQSNAVMEGRPTGTSKPRLLQMSLNNPKLKESELSFKPVQERRFCIKPSSCISSSVQHYSFPLQVPECQQQIRILIMGKAEMAWGHGTHHRNIKKVMMMVPIVFTLMSFIGIFTSVS